jgi:hypothetical protein
MPPCACRQPIGPTWTRLTRSAPFAEALGGRQLHELPTGCALAIARLAGCHKTSQLLQHAIREERGPAELKFGDYSDNRYVHEYENVHQLPEPVQCRGFQQLWKLDDLTLDTIARQFLPYYDGMHRDYRETLEPRTR